MGEAGHSFAGGGRSQVRTRGAAFKGDLPHLDGAAVDPEGSAIAARRAVFETDALHANVGELGVDHPAVVVVYIESSAISLAAAALKPHLTEATFRRFDSPKILPAAKVDGLIACACICHDALANWCMNVAPYDIERSCPVLTAADKGDVLELEISAAEPYCASSYGCSAVLAW